MSAVPWCAAWPVFPALQCAVALCCVWSRAPCLVLDCDAPECVPAAAAAQKMRPVAEPSQQAGRGSSTRSRPMIRCGQIRRLNQIYMLTYPCIALLHNNF